MLLTTHGAKLFSTKFPRNSRIDQFRALQTSNQQTMLTVAKNWVNDMKKIIVSHFGDIQKGWYSIREKNAETYRYGKIRKLLTMIRFIMESTMERLVVTSVEAYKAKLMNYTPLSLKIESPKGVEVGAVPVFCSARTAGASEFLSNAILEI